MSILKLFAKKKSSNIETNISNFSEIANKSQEYEKKSQKFAKNLQNDKSIVPNLCPCCGAPFDPNDLKCEYCGVSFRQEGPDTVLHRICFFADDRIVEWEDPQL